MQKLQGIKQRVNSKHVGVDTVRNSKVKIKKPYVSQVFSNSLPSAKLKEDLVEVSY